MNLDYGPEYLAYRKQVQAFLAANWPPPGVAEGASKRDTERAFRNAATEAGYLYRDVPKQYGGSEQAPDVLKSQLIRECFARARAPAEVPGIGMMLLVPTLLECGTQRQKEKFIPKTLTGEYPWAQGYSEPNSGSDLASLRTKAELLGAEWIINGQKIWSTFAQHARFMFALVRTEPDASTKHAGISYLLLDLKQPGVTIRPLRQMTGGKEFCEVFFNDARTPADWIVGQRGEGWQVSRATLKHERSSIGGAAASQTLFDKLVDLAAKSTLDGRPAIKHPLIRERLAALDGYVQSHVYSNYRQLSMTLRGEDAGPVTLMNKLVSTQIGHEVAKIARDLMGDRFLLTPPDEGGKGGGTEKWPQKWNGQFMGSLGVAIAGGTSNIQRNVIAERGYGLPRDPAMKDA